jgi:hypothetical protein
MPSSKGIGPRTSDTRMPSKLLPVIIRAVALVAGILPLACSQSTPGPTTDADGNFPGSSDATAEQTSDDLVIVPEGLSNTNMDGQDMGLTLLAFTLVQETTGPKFYAAVRNDGDTPSCEAGMTTYFVDKADQVVTESGNVLLSGRLYRMDDGTIIACIAPGQVAMAAATDLPSSMMIDQLGYLKHLFPAFTVPGVVPIPGLSVSDVQIVATEAGNAYTGRVTNGLDVAVSSPAVTIFPVNRVGRPLGVATSSETSDIPPGGSWTFKTSAVYDLGVGYVAYPDASIAK